MSFFTNLLEFMTAIPKMIADIVTSVANLITSVVDGLTKISEFLAKLPEILSELAQDAPGILATIGGAFFGWFVGENLYGLFGSIPFSFGGAFLGYMGRREIFDDPTRYATRLVHILTPLVGFGMGIALVDIILPMTGRMNTLTDFRYVGGVFGAVIGYLLTESVLQGLGLLVRQHRKGKHHGTHGSSSLPSAKLSPLTDKQRITEEDLELNLKRFLQTGRMRIQ
jgi:hypothetical protein